MGGRKKLNLKLFTKLCTQLDIHFLRRKVTSEKKLSLLLDTMIAVVTMTHAENCTLDIGIHFNLCLSGPNSHLKQFVTAF